MVPERKFTTIHEVLFYKPAPNRLQQVLFDNDIKKSPTFNDFYFDLALDELLEAGKITIEHNQIWYTLRTGHITRIASLGGLLIQDTTA